MTSFRTIYSVEAYTMDGEMVAHRFASNKKTAEKIARKYKQYETHIFKLRKCEHLFVMPEDVEA